MNEDNFKQFGECLDTLYRIMRQSDEDTKFMISEYYDGLSEVYDTVKELNGYKDRSDD